MAWECIVDDWNVWSESTVQSLGNTVAWVDLGQIYSGPSGSPVHSPVSHPALQTFLSSKEYWTYRANASRLQRCSCYFYVPCDFKDADLNTATKAWSSENTGLLPVVSETVTKRGIQEHVWKMFGQFLYLIATSTPDNQK